MPHIVPIDCHYTDRAGVAGAYLVRQGDRAAFVEANTTPAVPRLLAALAAEGMTPAQVDLVIVTHIHLDHAGGAGALMRACPRATLLAHPKAAPHAVDPTKIIAGATEVYGTEAFDRLYGEVVPVPQARIRVMQDGDTASLGDHRFTFLHTPGHANHHFVVHDDDAVFTGDSFGILYPHLQRNGPFIFPSTTPTGFDPQAAHASVDRIVGTGAHTVYPTHFGPHTDLPTLAEELHRQLDDYAALVDEADASGRDAEALDAHCLAEVRRLFEAELARHDLQADPVARELVAFDATLNAQGVAFAVRKRRYKRAQSA